jgi:hypothetical protein
MAERFRDSAMAMSDFMITIEANSMEAGKSMSQINSYAKSNKNRLCKESPVLPEFIPGWTQQPLNNLQRTGIFGHSRTSKVYTLLHAAVT